MSAMIQEQYIEICLGQERYAVRIQEIQEIIKWQAITRIPRSKAYVKGIISLRGKVIPVMSLGSRFGLVEEPTSKTTRIIIVNHADERVGMIVDRVNQVITISDIQSYSDKERGSESSWIAGYGHTPSGLVCILKLEQVFQN